MTSNEHNHRHEKRGRSDKNDGNTSDDSLILRVDDVDDRTPLLHNTNRMSTTREESLADGLQSLSIHCHLPDDKFDFGSRNRLILVLFICILFMLIEIVGTYLD
jgi:hypothetical protein